MPGWHKHLREPEVLPPCATCGRTNVCPNCSSILARSNVTSVESDAGLREALEKIGILCEEDPSRFHYDEVRAIARQALDREKPGETHADGYRD